MPAFIRCIDTETTGTKPHQGDHIVKVAAVNLLPGEAISRGFSRTVHPGPIDPNSTYNPALTRQALRSGKPAAQIIPQFRGAPLYAMHNVAFDWPKLEPYLEPHPTICTLLCACAIWPNLRRWRPELCLDRQGYPTPYALGHLYRTIFGEELTGWHSPLADAWACAAILQKLLDAHTVDELVSITKGASSLVGVGQVQEVDARSEVVRAPPDNLMPPNLEGVTARQPDSPI